MGSVITATEYKEPSERISPLGFASSILNGNTVEGGLRSLTYKSIFALKLVDEADLVKGCIISEEPQLTRIIDTDVTQDRVEKLRAEIEQLKHAQHGRGNADELINHYNAQLDQELANKTVGTAYSSEVKKFHQELFPDSNISYGANSHVVHSVASTVKVQRMEDVEGFDRSIYDRARERKLEEERIQQQEIQQERERKEQEKRAKEQERLRAEQQQQEEQRQQQEAASASAASGIGNYAAPYDNGVPNAQPGAPYNDDAMHLDGGESYSGSGFTPSAPFTPSATFTPNSGYTPAAEYPTDYPMAQDSPYSQAQSPY